MDVGTLAFVVLFGAIVLVAALVLAVQALRGGRRERNADQREGTGSAAAGLAHFGRGAGGGRG